LPEGFTQNAEKLLDGRKDPVCHSTAGPGAALGF